MNFFYFFVFLVILGANNAKDLKCYEGSFRDGEDPPTSPGSVEECYRSDDQCMTIVKLEPDNYSVEKGCGECKDFHEKCTSCKEDKCNKDWPKDNRKHFECYSGEYEEIPTSPGNVKPCYDRGGNQNHSCVTKVRKDIVTGKFTFEKACGNCMPYDEHCEACSEEKCNVDWPKVFDCYSGHYDSIINGSDVPTSPGFVEKCIDLGGYSCLTSVNYGYKQYKINKGCGKCHAFDDGCKPCNGDKCNYEWPEDNRRDMKCYMGYYDQNDVDVPSEPGNITECYDEGCRTIVRMTPMTYSVVKDCGKCLRMDDENVTCTPCSEDNCNAEWPKDDRTIKCHSGIEMEGHEYNSFKEVKCRLGIENCTREEFHVDGVKFVQKMCANKCTYCNGVIKDVNATDEDKKRCSHYVGCWQCSGNLCNGVGVPTLNVPFTLAVMAFAILIGVRNGDNMIGFLY